MSENDIVQRLRAERLRVRAEKDYWVHWTDAVEAADEIERLRKAMAKWLDKWERMECEWCGHLQSGERREAER